MQSDLTPDSGKIQTRDSLLYDENQLRDEGSCCIFDFFNNFGKKSRGKNTTNDSFISKDKISLINQTHYAVNGTRNSIEKGQDFQQVIGQLQTQNVRKSILTPKYKDLPRNKLFLFKSKGPKNSILAKLTEKTFKLNVCGDFDGKSSLCEIIQPKEVFKLFEFGIDCTQDSWNSATPEAIAKYIATRVSGQSLIVDLGCGIGGNTIQFAQTCDFVIAVEINDQHLCHARNNAIKYRVEEKVDFVHGNLLSLRKLRANTVFINPTVNNVAKIDLFRDCQPNIFQIMENALHIAPNIILQLPRNIDIFQLPAIFDVQRYQFLQDNYPFNYTLEIEEVMVNKKIEYYIIYFGQVADIKDEEYNQFLADQLMKTGSEFDGFDVSDRIVDILAQIKLVVGINPAQIIGSYKMFQLIGLSIKECPPKQTLIQYFLSYAIMNGYITFDQVKSFGPLIRLNHDKTPRISEYQSTQDVQIEQRINPILQRSVTKRAKQNTSPMDEVLKSPSEYSFNGDNNMIQSDPYIPFSQGLKQELLEYSEEEKTLTWNFSQRTQPYDSSK